METLPLLAGDHRLIRLLPDSWDNQQRVMALGWNPASASTGATVQLRLLASRATLRVIVHVQVDNSTYDPPSAYQTTVVDCRENRQQDVEIPRTGVHAFWVWLIPAFEEPDESLTLYDGADAADHASIVYLGV